MPASSSATENRYDRSVFGEGVLGWVYEYANLERIDKRDALATGLELGVQLRGEWRHAGTRTGARVYEPGTVHVISPAERYELSCQARRDETGLQVGFIIYPDELTGFAPADADVVFTPRAAVDRRFLDFCRAFSEETIPTAQARDEVLRWVRAHVDIVPPDPLVAAKRAIDRSFAQPLYLEHLCRSPRSRRWSASRTSRTSTRRSPRSTARRRRSTAAGVRASSSGPSDR